MIQIPYDRVKACIQEQAKLSAKEVEAKVDEKLASLSGLISRDGAIHIVANELGVKVMPSMDKLKVKDLLPGMRSVVLNLKVLRKYELREFNRDGRQGKVSSFLAGDETGVVRVTMWNEHADKLSSIDEGVTVQVKDLMVKENQGRLELHMNTQSDLIIEPKGVTVTVSAAGPERTYTHKKIGELHSEDVYVDILGTIVQVFDPRSFAKKDGGSGMVANVVLDDGSGTIRASFWNDDVRTLLGEAVDRPDRLPDVKLELLGHIVKVQGRCKLNAAYNSLELSVDRFERNPDPQVEMARLE